MAQAKDTPQHDRQHGRHLMQPPAEKLAAKLARFGVDLSALYPMPPICELKDRVPILVTPVLKVHPHLGELERYTHRLTARSLDELKDWVGIPNRVVRKTRSCAKPRDVCIHHLPAQSAIDFAQLETERRLAVKDMAFNLLYGEAEEKVIQRPPHKQIVDYMLQSSQEIPFFMAQDLIVCPGEKITFNGFGMLYFNNVVVYGSGQIKLGNYTKLHAYQVVHV